MDKGTGMTIFVTGGSGFVGLALLERLLGEGHSVVNFDRRAVPEPLRPRLAALPGRLIEEEGDVCDPASLAASLRRHAPQRMIHAAAVTSAAAREASAPETVLGVNIIGTANAARAAALAGVARFVLVGSVAAFGQGHPGTASLDEETLHAPRSLYALGKAAAETVVARVGELHGLDWVLGRLCTVFGPYEHATGLRDTLSPVHQVTAAAVAGQAVVLPRAARKNWHYVRDAAHGLATLLDAPALRHRAYNLGPAAVWPLSAWCARLEQRYPAFRWSIGAGEGTAVELYGDHDGPLLSGERFRAELGPTSHHDLDAAFADYMRFLGETDGFGLSAA
jgi:nucleoside-diphosphate-sugar epimerase